LDNKFSRARVAGGVAPARAAGSGAWILFDPPHIVYSLQRKSRNMSAFCFFMQNEHVLIGIRSCYPSFT
jgi:hypothetical protein